MQGLFEVAVALFDDPLVFVDAEHVERGQRAPGWVGQVGGQGVEPVVGGCAGDGVRVAVPGDGGFALVVDAGGDGDQVGDAVSDDLGDPVVDLLAGFVVAPAEAVADRVSASSAVVRARSRASATEAASSEDQM